MPASMSRLLPVALLLSLLAGGAGAQEQPSELTELNWPRKYEKDGDKLVVYDPQIDSWENHEVLKARSAVVVTASGEKADAFGIVEFEVKTETQPESRQALLKDRTITAVRFSGLPKDIAVTKGLISEDALLVKKPFTSEVLIEALRVVIAERATP